MQLRLKRFCEARAVIFCSTSPLPPTSTAMGRQAKNTCSRSSAGERLKNRCGSLVCKKEAAAPRSKYCNGCFNKKLSAAGKRSSSKFLKKESVVLLKEFQEHSQWAASHLVVAIPIRCKHP